MASKGRLFKKPSLDFFNNAGSNKSPTKPKSNASPAPLRVDLFGGGKEGASTESSASETSPPSETAERLTSPTSPTKRPARLKEVEEDRPEEPEMNALRAISSKEVLVRMLEDPACLWKFALFVCGETSAETLMFYLNSEQHRQDLHRLHALTRRVHDMHVPTNAALALNISAAERWQLEQDSAAFLRLEDPFEAAREVALDKMLIDAWPRFIRHRLDLFHELEMRNMGVKVGLIDLATSFCISSARPADDFAIFAISDGFSAVTGYSRREVVGRNCRFLQGSGTDQAAVERISAALRFGQSCEELLLNFKSDGTPFQNFIRITPLRNANGSITAFLGYQVNIDPHDGLTPLMGDRLDIPDDRRFASDQYLRAAEAFGRQAQGAKAVDVPPSVTREMRLSLASWLSVALQKPVLRPTVSTLSTKTSTGREDKVKKRKSTASLKRTSVSSLSDVMDGVSLRSGQRSDRGMGMRWLYLDRDGSTILHCSAALHPRYAPGKDFAALVKPYNPSLPKRLRQLVKIGDTAYEKARLALDANEPVRLIDTILTMTPLKDHSAVVGVVLLISIG